MAEFGIGKAAKLGAILGIGWGIIFTGCLMNISSPLLAIEITSAIYGTILFVVFTAATWIPGFVDARTVDKIGGGTGKIPEDDDEPDQ